MSLTINTNIINDTDQYLLDAKCVKGGYVVVDSISARNNLPAATTIVGTLCFCTADSTFYQKTSDGWEKIPESVLKDQGTSNSGKYLKVNKSGMLEPSDMDQIVETLPTSNLDPNINYYLKTTNAEGTTYTLYKAINGALYKVGGDDSRVDELLADVENLESSVYNVIEPSINRYTLSYDTKVMKFVETNVKTGQVLNTTEFGIISAEETTNTAITITPITKTPIVSTLDAIPNIEFTFSNTFSEASGGADTDEEVNIIWRVDNAAVKTEKLKSKQDGEFILHSFPVQNYISKSGSHSVLVSMKDAYGASASFAWKINAVSLSVNLVMSKTDNNTDYCVYEEEDIKLKYVPYGTISKNIFIEYKGIADTKYRSLASYYGVTAHGTEMPEGTSYVTLAKRNLSHGAYMIRAWSEATVDGVKITSKIKYVDVIYAQKNNTTPIIAWPDEDVLYKQYTEVNNRYAIYNPSGDTANVKLYIKEPDNNYKLVSSGAVDNLIEKTWTYLPLSYGDYGFKIVVGEETIDREKILTIAKEAYQIETVKDNLVIDFNPQGRSNSDTERLWKEGDYQLTVGENFDWYNGGWITDEEGATAFCVKAGSRAYINFPLFRRHTGNGIYDIYRSFKFVFKTTHCKNFYAEAIKCGEDDDNTRLRIKAQNAFLYLGGEEVRVDYMEDEKLELDYVVSPTSNLVSVFIDADPSKLGRYAGTIYTSNERYIEIGSDDCDTYLYRFKAFDRALGYAEVLQNYVTDSPIGSQMKERYEKIDIWDMSKHMDSDFAAKPYLERIKTLFEDINPGRRGSSDGKPITWIDYNKLAEKNPNLRILIVTCPRFTTDKDDKVEGCTVQQIMGNGQDPKHNWIAYDVRIKGQGTSSNKYGYSGRNLDFKFNDGFISYVNGVEGTKQSKYSMTDKSIGVKYFNIKVNIASSENANNACIAERFNTYDPFLAARKSALTFMDSSKREKVRDTMEFHPCVIFINETQKNYEGNYVAQRNDILGEPEWYVLDENDVSSRVSPVEGPLNVLHFYAAGDMGNSKKNHEVFGMDEDAYDNYLAAGEVLETKQSVIDAINAQTEGKDEYIQVGETKYYYPKECIVEIADNNTPAQYFKFNNKFTEQGIFDVLPDEVWDDTEDVEFRYPEVLGDTKDDLVAEILEEALKNGQTMDESGAKALAKETGTYYLVELAEKKLRDSARRAWQWVAQTDLSTAKTQAQINALGTGKDDYRIFKRHAITGDYLDGSNNVITDPLGANKGKRVAIQVTYDGTTYSYDSYEYRKAKFQNEFSDYFVKDSALYYYLFTARYQMIDNRAKNCFLHTADGLHWDFSFDYDNDTALGIDNFGKLVLEYGTEDIDTFETTDKDGNVITTGRFNAYESALWCNVRDCFGPDLRDKYESLEANGCWSKDGLCDQFEAYQNIKPAGIQALDMYNKYVRPYTAGHYSMSNEDASIYIPMMNGRKASQRKRFETYQERYFNTKYYTTQAKSNAIVLRPTSGGGAGGEVGLTIKAYSKFYPNWAPSGDAPVREAPHRITKEGEEYYMKFSLGNDESLSSTVLHLYGGPCYADLGDLSFMAPSTATLSTGEKLNTIILGNDSANYQNGSLTDITLPENVEHLNIDNCTKLTTLHLNGEGEEKPCTQLKKLSARITYNGATPAGKGLSQLTLPSNGLLEEANLGHLQELFGENLARLHTLTVQGAQLKNLNLENCGDWSHVGNKGETYSDNLKTVISNSAIGRSKSDPGRVRLTNVRMDFDESWNDEIPSGEGVRLMDRVLLAKGYNEFGGEINEGSESLGWGGSYVDGSLHYAELATGTKSNYESAWKVSVQVDDPIEQYVVNFVDDDGTLLRTFYYTIDDYGEATVYEPTSQGKMSVPVKEQDAQYTYEWKYWYNKKNDKIELHPVEPNNYQTITEDTTYVAHYSKTPRKYQITWDFGHGEPLQTLSLDYGTKLNPPSGFSDAPCRVGANRYDLFKGWDKPLDKVKHDMTIKALWENGDISQYNVNNVDPEKLNPAQLYTIRNTKNNLGDWFVQKDRVTVNLGLYPEYTPINENDVNDPFLTHVLAEEEYFFKDDPNNGLRIIDTEMQLLDADKEWTLLLDSYMGEQVFNSTVPTMDYTQKEDNNGVLLSCQSSDSVGLRIAMKNSSLYVYWYGQEFSVKRTDYGRIVLRHPKGNVLYVGYSDPTSAIQIEGQIYTSQTLTPVSSSVILGGVKTSAGYRNPATGYIKKCLLWYTDIGEQEAVELATWPREDWKFSVANKAKDDGTIQGLYGNDSIDLWSDSQCLYTTYWAEKGSVSTPNNSSPTIYPNSNIHKLFMKFRSGFSKPWKSLLKKQLIKYINTYPEEKKNYEIPNTYEKNGSTSPINWTITADAFDYNNPAKYIQSFETDIYAPAYSDVATVWTIASKDSVCGKDDLLTSEQYGYVNGTSSNPGTLQYAKALPYTSEGGTYLEGFVNSSQKWSRNYPSNRPGWFYKQYPSTTSWDTILTQNNDEKWIYPQPTNPLRDSQQAKELFDGCLWIKTNNPQTVTSFYYDSKTYNNPMVFWNGKWYNEGQGYTWLRTKSAKDIITIQGYHNNYGYNSAVALGTSQHWLALSTTYGVVPCISI